MKIDTNISVVNSQYNVQIDLSRWTAIELQKIEEFGEPLIDIGGVFTGALARPGDTNTTVSITGGSGTGAVATPIIDLETGAINGYTVVSQGSGYLSTPSVGIVGDGSGATATAVVTGGQVVSVSVVTGGTGYHVSPVPINLTFPSALRRIKSDFPIKKIFDLEDDVNSDVQAQFYTTTLIGRLTAAKNALVQSSVPFEGENSVTV